jgi:hypothetical protein
MSTTRTAGITIDGDGRRTINKELSFYALRRRLAANPSEHRTRLFSLTPICGCAYRWPGMEAILRQNRRRITCPSLSASLSS